MLCRRNWQLNSEHGQRVYRPTPDNLPAKNQAPRGFLGVAGLCRIIARAATIDFYKLSFSIVIFMESKNVTPKVTPNFLRWTTGGVALFSGKAPGRRKAHRRAVSGSFPLLHGRRVSPAGKDAHRPPMGQKTAPAVVAGADGVLVAVEGLQGAVGVHQSRRRIFANTGEPRCAVR